MDDPLEDHSAHDTVALAGADRECGRAMYLCLLAPFFFSLLTPRVPYIPMSLFASSVHPTGGRPSRKRKVHLLSLKMPMLFMACTHFTFIRSHIAINQI